MKYIIGSTLLGLNTSTSDKDVLNISNDSSYTLLYNNGIDYHNRSVENIKYYMTFPNENDLIIQLYNYQLDIDIIKQDFPIIYHILDYKEKLKRLLNLFIIQEFSVFGKVSKGVYSRTMNRYVLPKIFYHIAYNLFILENNSVKLTDEQLKIVQKIHDKEMPVDYGEELKQRILNLK